MLLDGQFWSLIDRKDREIPWEVLLYPGQYVAGAHKCMDWIDEKSSRILTHKKQSSANTYVLKKYCTLSYGKLLYRLREQYGDDTKVLDMLERKGTPERLSSPTPPD